MADDYSETAYCYRGIGAFSEAMTCLRKALKLVGNDPDLAIKRISYLKSGTQCLLNMDSLEQARAFANEALSIATRLGFPK